MDRPLCKKHRKVLYRSKKDALGSLVGQLRSKRVRVYPCSEYGGKFHLTKESIRHQIS